MLLKDNFVIILAILTVIVMKYVLLSIDSFYKNLDIRQLWNFCEQDMGKMKSMTLPFYDL